MFSHWNPAFTPLRCRAVFALKTTMWSGNTASKTCSKTFRVFCVNRRECRWRRKLMRLAGIAVFAAIAALSVGAALSESFEYFVVPAKPGNPRNSEADMLRLRDGRLMLAWIDFQGEAGSDCATANISAMYSKDQGRTWGDKFTLQQNI